MILKNKANQKADFTRRLLSYSAAGVAAMAASSPAEGAIISFDVLDALDATVDFSLLGSPDFEIFDTYTGSASSSSILGGIYISPLGSGRGVAVDASSGGGGSGFVLALPPGFLIGGGLNFNEGNSRALVWTSNSSWSNGNFTPGNLAYIGVRLSIAGNFHYGWIAFTEDPNEHFDGIVSGSAYESCAGVGIEAGATKGGATCGPSSSVPEPSSLALMAAGAAGVFALKRRRMTAQSEPEA